MWPYLEIRPITLRLNGAMLVVPGPRGLVCLVEEEGIKRAHEDSVRRSHVHTKQRGVWSQEKTKPPNAFVLDLHPTQLWESQLLLLKSHPICRILSGNPSQVTQSLKACPGLPARAKVWICSPCPGCSCRLQKRPTFWADVNQACEDSLPTYPPTSLSSTHPSSLAYLISSSRLLTTLF